MDGPSQFGHGSHQARGSVPSCRLWACFDSVVLAGSELSHSDTSGARSTNPPPATVRGWTPTFTCRLRDDRYRPGPRAGSRSRLDREGLPQAGVGNPDLPARRAWAHLVGNQSLCGLSVPSVTTDLPEWLDPDRWRSPPDRPGGLRGAAAATGEDAFPRDLRLTCPYRRVGGTPGSLGRNGIRSWIPSRDAR